MEDAPDQKLDTAGVSNKSAIDDVADEDQLAAAPSSHLIKVRPDQGDILDNIKKPIIAKNIFNSPTIK